MQLPPLSPAVPADSQTIRSDFSSSLQVMLYCSHISDLASAATLTQTSWRNVIGRVKGKDVGCLKVFFLMEKYSYLRWENTCAPRHCPFNKMAWSLSPGQVPNYLHLNFDQLNSSIKR